MIERISALQNKNSHCINNIKKSLTSALWLSKYKNNFSIIERLFMKRISIPTFLYLLSRVIKRILCAKSYNSPHIHPRKPYIFIK